MNPSAVKVLRYLTGNENIASISTDKLEKLTEENPYFSVGHFYLAKKLKEENDNGFLSQVQKTALYFSNPYWLDYQLTYNPLEEIVHGENNIIEESENAGLPLETELTKNEEASINIEHKPVDTHVAEISSYNEEKTVQAEEEIAAITRGPGVETEQFLDEAADMAKTFVHHNIEQVIPEAQNSAGLEGTNVLEELVPAKPETDNTNKEFLNEISKLSEEDVEPFLPKTEGSVTNSYIIEETKKDESAGQDEHERMFQNIKAMLDATSEEADADTKNAVIPIDPYYTVDYFASQGIKLELDQNPQDELGRHLKKFTQWLKHMKKLGPEDATEVIARTETEADIQKIADKSNMAREVVTEAMASVLEKQGKKDKAIELYNKLSFLNPDKSAYFAVKIKNLKGI